MDSTAQGALIAAVIAVVLGALGLIGGVVGYVQGSAALRRATLIRQRAAAAEEAALQAKDQAEQAARTAQSVLDRLSGFRGSGEVADIPTGPLVLPHRVPAPTETGEVATSASDRPEVEAVSAEPAAPSPFTRPTSAPDQALAPTFFSTLPGQGAPEAPRPVVFPPNTGPIPTDFSGEPQPTPAIPVIEPTAAASGLFEPSGIRPDAVAPETGPTTAPPTTGPTVVPTSTGPTGAPTETGATAVPTEAGQAAVRASRGPAAVPTATGSIGTPASTGPTPVPTANGPTGDGTSAGPSAVPIETGPGAIPASTSPAAVPADTGPTAGSTSAASDRTDSASPQQVAPAAPPAGPPPSDEAEIPVIEVEPPQRSSTGQVTAGGQAPPPLDWAEALRTGAIPLPARSRGTYAAPKKAQGQPQGPARFEIRVVGRQKFEAVNVGGATAEQAAIEGSGEDSHLVRPLETRAKPVKPGQSIAFSVLRVEGRQVSVRVSWLAAGDEEQAVLAVP